MTSIRKVLAQPDLILLQRNPDKRLSPVMYEEAGRQAGGGHGGGLWIMGQISKQRGGRNILLRKMNGVERRYIYFIPTARTG